MFAAGSRACALCQEPIWVDLRQGDLGHGPDGKAIGWTLVYRHFADGRVKDYSWVQDLKRSPEMRDCELDHTVPLIEGGAHDWHNLRLLCMDCHKAETAALARRRAARRKAVAPQTALDLGGTR